MHSFADMTQPSALLDRTLPPPAFAVADFPLPKPRRFLLANGLPVYFIESGVHPVTGLSLSFDAGTWNAPSKELAFLSLKMLGEGTARRSAAQLMEEIDRYGASLELSTGFDHAEIEMYSLARYLPPLLELVREMLTEATLPEAELDNLKNITIQNLRINREKTSYIASNKFREVLFGSQHPYGSPMQEETLRQIGRDQVQSFYRRALWQAPFGITLVGKATDADLKALDDILGSLPLQADFLPLLHPQGSPENWQLADHLYIERENAMQTSIRIGKRLNVDRLHSTANRRNGDYLPLTVVNEALGGFFGSRLMQNLREEKGLTYGIHSNIVMLKHEAYLVVGTDVKKELREQACEEIFKEIARLAAEPLDAEELSLVKNYMQGAYIGSLTTPFSIAERFKSIQLHQLPDDYYDDYVSRIEAMSASHLQEIAAQYLSSDWLTVMVG